MESVARKRRLYARPVAILWRLATSAERKLGFLGSIAAGLVVMFVGWALCSSLVGALVGIPLFSFGLLLVIRGIW